MLGAECRPRALCVAQHCGERDHLNDDLHIVTLPQELIQSPPIDLWPKISRRITVPLDVENILLTRLERDQEADNVRHLGRTGHGVSNLHREAVGTQRAETVALIQVKWATEQVT